MVDFYGINAGKYTLVPWIRHGYCRSAFSFGGGKWGRLFFILRQFCWSSLWSCEEEKHIQESSMDL